MMNKRESARTARGRILLPGGLYVAQHDQSIARANVVDLFSRSLFG